MKVFQSNPSMALVPIAKAMYLQQQTPNSPASTYSNEMIAPRPRTPRATILLVEDSPTQAAQFKLHFENLGYEVTVAASVAAAREKINQLVTSETNAKPDLIILDYLLPDEHSTKLCKELKTSELLKNISVLVFSTENRLKFMTDAYAAGADYYIVKNKEGLRTLELLVDSIIIRQRRQARRSTAC